MDPMLPDPLPSAWGFELEEWRDGYARLACVLQPRHLNFAGTVHGGVLLTMMDEAGGLAGVFDPDPGQSRLALTLSLTGQFTGQAQSGRIVAVGTKIRGGRQIFFSRAEVFDAQGGLLAFGSATFRYRNSHPERATPA